MTLPPAIKFKKPDSHSEEKLDQIIGIAVLWNSPMNAFGALAVLRSVCLNLQKDGIKSTSHGALYGQGLTGFDLPEVKGVGGFVVVTAYVDDRKAGIKSLCEFADSMGLNCEVAWADLDEDVWRIVRQAFPKMLLPFERFLSADVVTEFKTLLEAEEKAADKYIEAVQHFTQQPEPKQDASGE